MPFSRFRTMRRSIGQDAQPLGVFACVFMAALAAACLQSGLATLALVPATVSMILVFVGLVGRLRPMLPVPVRAARPSVRTLRLQR